MTTPRVIVTGIVVVSIVPVSAQQIPLRPGQYETTADMDLAGTKMTFKDTNCITPIELKDFSKTLMDADQEEHCKISDYKLTGNRLTFNANCQEEDVKVATTAEITFASDSYTGLMTSKDNEGRTTTIKTTGKRIGECTK